MPIRVRPPAGRRADDACRVGESRFLLLERHARTTNVLMSGEVCCQTAKNEIAPPARRRWGDDFAPSTGLRGASEKSPADSRCTEFDLRARVSRGGDRKKLRLPRTFDWCAHANGHSEEMLGLRSLEKRKVASPFRRLVASAIEKVSSAPAARVDDNKTGRDSQGAHSKRN
jgi:hypothetical protein